MFLGSGGTLHMGKTNTRDFFKKNLQFIKEPRLQTKYPRTRVYMEIQVMFMLM
jgi:hypothetical protein